MDINYPRYNKGDRLPHGVVNKVLGNLESINKSTGNTIDSFGIQLDKNNTVRKRAIFITTDPPGDAYPVRYASNVYWAKRYQPVDYVQAKGGAFTGSIIDDGVWVYNTSEIFIPKNTKILCELVNGKWWTAYGGGSAGTGGGGGSTSGDCCCNELDCLKRPVGYSGVVPVYGYTFTLSGFLCGCVGDPPPEGEAVVLTRVTLEDDTVFESERWTCVAPEGTSLECTVTSTYTWNGSSWDFVSKDIEGCSCSPSAPLADGTSFGQSATTTCTGTFESDGVTTMATAFWRLTIATTLTDGCDGTKLEFIME